MAYVDFTEEKELAAGQKGVESAASDEPSISLRVIRTIALRAEMESENIHILDHKSLTDDDKTHLESVFLNKVFPVLSPLAIDPAHPFPFIPNTGYSLALQLERNKDKRALQALLPPAF